jgi:predicted RNA-binding Zn ribbon-like protein
VARTLQVGLLPGGQAPNLAGGYVAGRDEAVRSAGRARDVDDMRAAPGEDVSCAVALVNTRHMSAGTEVDLLADAATAGRWLAKRGLLPGEAAPADPDDDANPIAERLRVLREAVRTLFAARFDGGPPPAADLALVNATLADAPLIPFLIWDGAGPRRGERPAGADPLALALARVASDALAVLTESGGSRPELAPCAAHGCIRWFLRTHAARQWCSNRCGDRVRAARHYARRRAQP